MLVLNLELVLIDPSANRQVLPEHEVRATRISDFRRNTSVISTMICFPWKLSKLHLELLYNPF